MPAARGAATENILKKKKKETPKKSPKSIKLNKTHTIPILQSQQEHLPAFTPGPGFSASTLPTRRPALPAGPGGHTDPQRQGPTAAASGTRCPPLRAGTPRQLTRCPQPAAPGDSAAAAAAPTGSCRSPAAAAAPGSPHRPGEAPPGDARPALGRAASGAERRRGSAHARAAAAAFSPVSLHTPFRYQDRRQPYRRPRRGAGLSFPRRGASPRRAGPGQARPGPARPQRDGSGLRAGAAQRSSDRAEQGTRGEQLPSTPNPLSPAANTAAAARRSPVAGPAAAATATRKSSPLILPPPAGVTAQGGQWEVRGGAGAPVSRWVAAGGRWRGFPCPACYPCCALPTAGLGAFPGPVGRARGGTYRPNSPRHRPAAGRARGSVRGGFRLASPALGGCRGSLRPGRARLPMMRVCLAGLAEQR